MEGEAGSELLASITYLMTSPPPGQQVFFDASLSLFSHLKNTIHYWPCDMKTA